MSSVFIYGGTFDPVHNGHLFTAQCVYDTFKPDTVLFVPCKQPVLKASSQASAKDRLNMLELALHELNPLQAFSVCTYELLSNKPSYMVHTLEYLQQCYPQDTVFTLIMGTDAFRDLPRWHQWTRILCLCNILVLQRAEYPLTNLDSALQALLRQHKTECNQILVTRPHGYIRIFDGGQYAESSTAIRQHQHPNETFCPPAVVKYIQQHKLYQTQ